jgi:2-hydroxy-3-oxopropionate reductase
MRTSIGFIGLGIMGKPMSKNLLRAGHSVTVYDVLEEPVRELESAGAKAGRCSRDVAEQSDLIITMLPDSIDVENAVLEKDGIFEGIREGSIYIDMSTISPITTERIAKVASTKGISTLDAPVSGGEKGAIEASLSIMVGGDSQVFAKCLPVLRVLGQNIVHCGKIGSGQVVKACNQILVAGVLEAAGEALVLGAKAGVDPEIVLRVIAGGYAMRVLDVRGMMMLKGDFKPGFKTRLHHKDLSIALSAGSAYGVPLPATSVIHQMMTAMKALGRGDFDHTGIITVLEDLANVRIGKSRPD